MKNYQNNLGLEDISEEDSLSQSQLKGQSVSESFLEYSFDASYVANSKTNKLSINNIINKKQLQQIKEVNSITNKELDKIDQKIKNVKTKQKKSQKEKNLKEEK